MNPDHLARFRRILTRWTGLTLDGVTAVELADLLAERVAEAGVSTEVYLDRLAASRCRSDLVTLAPRLTVPETYFFRHGEQFRALAEVAIPAIVGERADSRLRLLSMGCATGEEAYTLAMVVRAALPRWPGTVTGVDMNPDVLRRAERGRYAEWSMRATPHAMRRRWFRPDGDGVVVDPEIRGLVRFVPGNLTDDGADWWEPGGYDVIFCRNVIMYHTPQHIAAAIDRLTAALAPGGFLFLGHAETTYGRADSLEPRQSHDTFYFQRTNDTAATPSQGAQPGPGQPQPVRPHAAQPAAAPLNRAPTGRRPVRVAGDPIARALELLRQERFTDALDLLAAEAGPDARLVRAVLLADLGRLDEAESECHRLLETDGLHAGAHYLLAVTREGAGDPSAAWSHARTAAYLDPGFAMPRLRLGLLARGRGDTETARHDFSAALTLLAGESGDRLLLFGGGFSRAALTDLCRTELRACGAVA